MAMAENESRPFRAGETAVAPVAAGARIFQGALLEIDVEGHVAPATKGVGKRYFGVALEPADNRDGAKGALSAAVRRQGAAAFAKSGSPRRGGLAYVVDDATVTDDPAGATALGRIADVDDDGVWADLGAAPGPAFSAASKELDFPEVAAGGQQELTVAVAGAAEGDAVLLGLPKAPAAGLAFDAYASADDTVTVRATNATESAVDPDAATFRVAVLKI